MMKEHISLNQLLALIICFNLGSSVVLGIGLEGKQDAWFVVLVSSFIGLEIVLAFHYIHSFSPEKNLYELMEYCFNRPIAVLISFIYILYFFYMAARVIRDFIELTSTVIMPNTPIEVLTLAIMLYILYLGIEVLGRTTEVFTPYSIIFFILLAIFLYASKNFTVENITPVLAGGIKPLMKVIFPYELVRPYGQIITFTCIFPLLDNFKKSINVLVFGVILSGFFLTVATLVVPLSLGNNIASRATFPLLSATRLVAIGEFIERIDAITVFIILLGILVKSSVFMFTGLKGLEYIFKIPYRSFIMPLMCIITLFTVFIARGIADHAFEGLQAIPYFLNLPLQFFIPMFMILILLVKKATSKKDNVHAIKK